MLAAVTSPTGELITVHRTFITPDGQKAPVPTLKKLCSPAGLMAGATIKIGTPSARPDGRLGVGIAEGIETALAAAILFDVPVWAGVSAHGLASFTSPPSVRNAYAFVDNDVSQTGQKAALQLAERLTRQGFTARIHTPPAIGTDWADPLPLAMVATGALTALSLAGQAHINVARNKHLTGPVSLFALVLADSGERKSTVDGFFTRAIREYEIAQAEALKPDVEAYQADLQAWGAKKAGVMGAIKAAARGTKPPPWLSVWWSVTGN